MAVRIIGEAPGAVKSATCRHCAAMLEYVPRDVQRRDGTDYTGGPDGCEWITCPRCGHNVVLRSW